MVRDKSPTTNFEWDINKDRINQSKLNTMSHFLKLSLRLLTRIASLPLTINTVHLKKRDIFVLERLEIAS